MTAQVRSVVVRLEAMVAKYIRDVNRAGDATEKSFDRVHASTSKAREEFVAADRAAAKLEQTTSRLGTSTKVTSSSQRALARDVDSVSAAAGRGARSIDQYSGRLRVVAELIATLGPGLLPLGAGGLAAVGALAGLFGGAAVGALGLLGAVQGVGDALKAVEKARLDPTVENLKAARDAMAQLSPEARRFVRHLEKMRPVLLALRDAGAEEFFPGLTDALDSLDRLAPILSQLMAASGRAGGDAIANAAESLTTDRWAPFLDFLVDEIPEAIDNTTQLLGSLSHAGAEMWMTFDPTNDKFIDWLTDVADRFDDWTGSVEGQNEIRDFLDYVEETGPDVADFVVGVADAFTQVAQAAAPLSGPVLQTLTAVANVVADVADSDLGTPLLSGVAALTLYSRGLQVAVGLQSKLYGTNASSRLQSQGTLGFTRGLAKDVKSSLPSLQEFGRVAAYMGQSSKSASKETLAARASVRSFAGQAARSAAPLAGLAVASTGLADGVGLSNTASLALAGSFAGPVGAALGGAAGLFIDVASASSDSSKSIEHMQDALDSLDFDRINAAAEEFEQKFAKYLDDDTWGDNITGPLKTLLSGGGFSEEFHRGQELIATRDRMVKEAADAQTAYNSVVADGGRAAFEAKYGLDALLDAMKKQQAVARSALDNQYAWGQAVLNIRGLLKDGSRGFNEFTEAGQNNYAAISSAADALNKMVEAGELTNGEYVKLRDQFIAFARQLGAGRAEAEAFANEMLDIPDSLAPEIAVQFDKQQLVEAKDAFDSLPPEVRTDIRADGIPQTEGAIDALVAKYKLSEKDRRALITLKDMASPRIQAILAQLREVKGRTVTITTQWQNVYLPSKGDPSRTKPGLGLLAPGAVRQADGGTVQGPRYPYGDKVLTYLAPGEEVITNRRGEADRFRADRAAGRIPAYADGGTVQGLAGGGTVRVRSHSDREADHVARGLKKMRQELASATKALEKETKARDTLVDRRNNLREGIRGGLDRGIWRPGGDEDVWTSSGDPVAGLYAQLADINRFDALSGRLKKKVSTAAFEEIIKDGNIDDLQAYATLPTAQLATFSKLYGVVQSRLTASSNRASDAVYAAPIAKANAQLAEQTREVKGLRRDVQHAAKNADKQQARNRAAAKKGASAAATRQHRGYVK
ncbi:hypothetical protein [Nocardioides sp. LML1-1-1.1]|uniref:hypothetical protein n=1 Tax=Nocardioides sp. LML1-1-1.1 TaxID=3135248 RepID=UPI00342AD8EC